MSDITRQQAIYYLKAMRTMCVFQDAFGEPVDTDVYDEALDMAINSLETDEAYQLEYERVEELKSKDNLCNSCSNISCEFQSGIVRKKCDFYRPNFLRQWYGEPKLHTEIDNCGNYYTMSISNGNEYEAESQHKQNIKVYAHDFSVSEEQAEKELRICKVVTTKQLEEMYQKFERKLWSVREDVRGDDMVEIGYAEQFLQDLLGEMGCWDEKV